MRRIGLSRLPKVAVVGLVLALAVVGAFLAYAFMQATPSRQAIPYDLEVGIPFETLYWGANAPYSAAANIVIDDEVTWSNVWPDGCGPDIVSCPPPPAVNFTSTTVLAVFSGTRPTTGYLTNVTSVSRTGSGILVDVRLTIPGNTCRVGQALTSPFHIVAIPKTDAKVEFATKTIVYDCGR